VWRLDEPFATRNVQAGLCGLRVHVRGFLGGTVGQGGEELMKTVRRVKSSSSTGSNPSQPNCTSRDNHGRRIEVSALMKDIGIRVLVLWLSILIRLVS